MTIAEERRQRAAWELAISYVTTRTVPEDQVKEFEAAEDQVRRENEAQEGIR